MWFSLYLSCLGFTDLQKSAKLCLRHTAKLSALFKKKYFPPISFLSYPSMNIHIFDSFIKFLRLFTFSIFFINISTCLLIHSSTVISILLFYNRNWSFPFYKFHFLRISISLLVFNIFSSSISIFSFALSIGM